MPVLSAIAFVAIAAVVGIIAANYKAEETIADSNVGEAVSTVETTIESIVIPQCMKYIDVLAFPDCKSLKRIDIPVIYIL